MVIQQSALFSNPTFQSPVVALNSPFLTSTNSAVLNGMNPGQVFTFKGNDFLGPATVQNNVDTFSRTASAQPDLFGRNPSSMNVLQNTADAVDQIFNANFGISSPITGNMPATTSGATVGTTTIPNGAVFGNIVSTPSPALLSDLLNYNPLMWDNPSATNVTLGTMDSFNKVMGGNGIFTPPVFNNGPLYPFIAPIQPSFSDVQISTLGGQVNNLPQALFFPDTAQSGSNLWNTTFVPTAVVPSSTTSGTTSNNNPMMQQFAMMGMFALMMASMNNNGSLI